MKKQKKLTFLLGVCVFLIFLLTMSIVCFADSPTYDNHYHSVCGTTCSCSDTHSKQIWQPLPTSTTTLTSGNYYLETSINFTGYNELIIDGNVSICLNGYNIYKNGTSKVVTVKSGTLTLSDCKETGKIQVTSSNKTSFSGGGALCLSESSSLKMYGGTVNCDALGDAIHCDTTGNLTIYNGSVSAYYEAVGIHTINDVAIYSGTITSTNGSGIRCGETYYPATFHNVTILGGYFEGKKNGVVFGKYTCTGKVTISGGEFYGKGPVPNATTYGYEYYGLAFGNSEGGTCNLIISGGTFRGKRGGFYNYNSQLNATISGGTFNSKYTQYTAGSSGIVADNGTFLIEGGMIYGIQHSSSYAVDTKITVTGGEILCIQGNSCDTGIFTIKVYGGTIGQVGTTVATDGIISYSANIEVYRGTIFGQEYAIDYYDVSSSMDSSGSILISGGDLSGKIADIFMGTRMVGTNATSAHLSMEGYTGNPITVALSSSVSNNAYVAKNVSASSMISISDSKYLAAYDSTNKAVYIIQHSHTYTAAVISSPTHTTVGIRKYTCNCGDSYTETIAKLPSHEWNDGIVTTEPTCTVEGVKIYTCICGDNYSEVIAASGHDYKADVTAPTCTDEGYTTYTCSICNYSYIADYTPTTEHEFDNDFDIDCNNCGYQRDAKKHGDVNADNMLNNKDCAILMRYLNGWDVEIDTNASNVNGDEKLNNKDYILLMRYLNGWDVVLK